MAIQTVNASDDLEPTSREKINDNFTDLDTTKADITYVDIEVAKKVGLTGDETVADRKNFTGTIDFDILPEIPTTTPTLDAQAVSKKHLDDVAVKLTGDQTVADRKNFTGTISYDILPEIPVAAPTLDAQVANKKYVDDTAIAGGVDADETHKGIIEVGTQAEVAAVTLDNKAVTPLKLGAAACMLAGNQTVAGVKTFSSTPILPAADATTDNNAITGLCPYVASADLRNSNDAEVTNTEAAYTLAKETVLNGDIKGIVTIKFDLKRTSATGDAVAYGKIYKNDVALGTERSRQDNVNWETFSEDLGPFASGDKIQIYIYGNYSGAAGPRVKNMRFYYKQQITKLCNKTLATPLEVDTTVVSMTNNS
jgi:hypothetical protein